MRPVRRHRETDTEIETMTMIKEFEDHPMPSMPCVNAVP